jgi:hypothetical protein
MRRGCQRRFDSTRRTKKQRAGKAAEKRADAAVRGAERINTPRMKGLLASLHERGLLSLFAIDGRIA